MNTGVVVVPSEGALEAVIGELRLIAPASDTWLLAIDGRSGAGKTEFAHAVVEHWFALTWTRAQILSMDALYPHWEGLDLGIDRGHQIVQHWRHPHGEPVTYRPTQWPGLAPQDVVTMDPHRPLIVEGVGALAVCGRLASTTVWLEVDADVRRHRALERDGEIFVPHWRTWAAQEEAYLRRHPPGARLIVRGTPGPAHD